MPGRAGMHPIGLVVLADDQFQKLLASIPWNMLGSRGIWKELLLWLELIRACCSSCVVYLRTERPRLEESEQRERKPEPQTRRTRNPENPEA